MRVLIACEESQEVCKAFRARGHEAYSCDIQECSGGHPEWHIQGDVLPILNGYRLFWTMDGAEHDYVLNDPWDLIIAHPPCTDLAVSGARHFARKRADGSQQRSIDFFMKFTDIDCEKVAIENPVCIMSSIYRKPDQIIQPWQFGHPVSKKRAFGLKGCLCYSQQTLSSRGKPTSTGLPMELRCKWREMRMGRSFLGMTRAQQKPGAKPFPASPALWQNNGDKEG